MCEKEPGNENGFSLIELLFVVAIITVLSAAVVSRGFFASKESTGGEQLINDMATRLYERRAEVRRLNGLRAATAFTPAAPPIGFDLTDPATTRSLVTEGVDGNDDGVDDTTGDRLTRLVSSARGGIEPYWNILYREDQIRLPRDWKLVASAAELGSIPLIAAGVRGRGLPVTNIGFDGFGSALYKNSAGVWEKTPSGMSGGKVITETAFWAFYFVRSDTPGAAVALAVYPSSGIVERFRYDGGVWRGFSDRVIGVK